RAVLEEPARDPIGPGRAVEARPRLVRHVTRLLPAVQRGAELVVIVVAAVVREDADRIENRLPLRELEERVEVKAVPRQAVGESPPVLRVRTADKDAVGSVDYAVIVDVVEDCVACR